MKDFKKLNAWQKAFETSKLCIKTLSQGTNYPQELNSITYQIVKSSISVPSNIAEGCGRKSVKEQLRFMEIALGSSFELETQLRLMSEVHFLLSDDLQPILDLNNEVQKMISGLMRYLKNQ